jgi:N-acetyl-alpha-D-muramate 1-phosphate uridylyltransferase
VSFDGSNVCYNKRNPTPDMKYIDFGLRVLTNKPMLGYRDKSIFDLADVYGELSASGKLAGYEVSDRFYEVGSPEGQAETESYLRKRVRLKYWLFCFSRRIFLVDFRSSCLGKGAEMK